MTEPTTAQKSARTLLEVSGGDPTIAASIVHKTREQMVDLGTITADAADLFEEILAALDATQNATPDPDENR